MAAGACHGHIVFTVRKQRVMDAFYINMVIRLWRQEVKGDGLKGKPLSC